MKKLLLLNLDGLQYGVWKEEILSMEMQVIHWLPSTDKTTSAVSIIKRRTVTLADLAVHIGLTPISRNQKKLVLLLPDQNRVAGFMVDGEAKEIQVSADAVYPMPDYMQTSVVNTCVLSNSRLTPVINIKVLHKYLQATDYQPVVPKYQIEVPQQQAVSSQNNLRIFACNGRAFGASAKSIEQKILKPSSITQLALTPEYVKGITFHNEKVVPVIDLPHRMHQSTTGQQEMILIAAVAGQDIGFLVDSDIGELSARGYVAKPLPQLVQSDWLQFAAVRSQRVIPIVDFEVLLSEQPDLIEDEPVVQESTLPSQFQSLFGKEDVKVVEFSLLGASHAIPSLETEDSFPFKPYLPVPNGEIIVAGIVLHGEELLPVLDLARCFGRQSRPTSSWHFIPIKNRDFHVLIMTDTLIGDLSLPVDMQRELPFMAPDSVVYGCYPAENGVRLIFNIEALSVYFDDEQNLELISSLSTELQLPNIAGDPPVQKIAAMKPLPVAMEKKVEMLTAEKKIAVKQAEVIEENPLPVAPVQETATIEEPETPEAPELVAEEEIASVEELEVKQEIELPVAAEEEELYSSENAIELGAEEPGQQADEFEESGDTEDTIVTADVTAGVTAGVTAAVASKPVKVMETSEDVESTAEHVVKTDLEVETGKLLANLSESLAAEGVEISQEVEPVVTPEADPDLEVETGKLLNSLSKSLVSPHSELEEQIQVADDEGMEEPETLFDDNDFATEAEVDGREIFQTVYTVPESEMIKNNEPVKNLEEMLAEFIAPPPESSVAKEATREKMLLTVDPVPEKPADEPDIVEEPSDPVAAKPTRKKANQKLITELAALNTPVVDLEQKKNRTWVYSSVAGIALSAAALIYLPGMFDETDDKVESIPPRLDSIELAVFPQAEEPEKPLPALKTIETGKEGSVEPVIQDNLAEMLANPSILLEKEEPATDLDEPGNSTQKNEEVAPIVSAALPQDEKLEKTLLDEKTIETVKEDSVKPVIKDYLADMLPDLSMPLEKEEPATDVDEPEDSPPKKEKVEPIESTPLDEKPKKPLIDRKTVKPQEKAATESVVKDKAIPVVAETSKPSPATTPKNISPQPAAIEAEKKKSIKQGVVKKTTSDADVATTTPSTTTKPEKVLHKSKPETMGDNGEKITSAMQKSAAPSLLPPTPPASESTSLDSGSENMYIVQEGDSLWLIAERYTGDGNNYYKLIKNNTIPNPNLIYPGQIIILKK